MYVSYTKIPCQSVTKSPYFPVLVFFSTTRVRHTNTTRTQAEYQPPGISVFCASSQHSKLSQNFICSFIPVIQEETGLTFLLYAGNIVQREQMLLQRKHIPREIMFMVPVSASPYSLQDFLRNRQ